jgi:hypothetical protein
MSLIRNSDHGPTGLGYLIIDQRGAGLPVEGTAEVLLERDTYTCTHCNAVVVMNPARKRERYRCVGCSHHICDPCAADAATGVPCKTMKQRYEESLEVLARPALFL